jgi:hypothetical protein
VQRSFFSNRSLAAEGESVRADGDFITEDKGVVHHLRRAHAFLQAEFQPAQESRFLAALGMTLSSRSV